MMLRGKLTLFAKIALVTGGMAFMLNSVKAEGTILGEAKERQTFKNLSEQVFTESIEAYDNYVGGIADVMRATCDYDNPVAVFATYLEMINSGDITFTSREVATNEIDIPGYWGMNVATGEAVCRHHADNLARILNKLDLEAGLVLGEMFEGDKPVNNPNHAVVYVDYEGDILLLDPTNGTIFVKGDKYYETVDNKYKFAPSLSCDQIYGFADDNIPAYFNKKDISDKKEFYSSLLDMFKEVAEAQKNDIHLTCRKNLTEYEIAIFKEMVYYQTMYKVVEDRLGEDATQNEIISDILNTYETMDEIHEEYQELIESGYKPSM